ncbi:MAG: arylsulfatase [Planctomycetaceae bacterium]|nr:arylsulfatase [Planctomycetaceae bacterium]
MQRSLSLFIYLSTCFIFVSNATIPSSFAQDQALQQKPNIVFILADDLGYGDLSCYGQKIFSTPNIDFLAANGLRFTQCYAGSTVCAPSRCALLTGKHTGHGYIRGNLGAPGGREGDYPLSSDTITFADILQKNGYVNGVFGKWGLGNFMNSGSPLRQGFDEFYGYYGQVDAHNYYPPFLYRNDKKIMLDGKTYSHDLIINEAKRFITENKDRPFFCFMTVTIPHAAMQVPEKYVTPWREQFKAFDSLEVRYSSANTVRNPVAAFPAMMTKLDESVGEITQLLDNLGLTENTIVIFSSDNGPHVEGGHSDKIFDFHSNGPLRGHKRDLTEGGIRVPLIVRWPAKIKPGTETQHICAFWDFYPTICELIGENSPSGLDGISFLPTWLGETDRQKEHDYLYWEFYEQGGKRAARLGDWKGVQDDLANHPDGPIAIYNLAEDIGEKNDLANDHPEKVEEFRQVFKQAHRPSSIFVLKEDDNSTK